MSLTLPRLPLEPHEKVYTISDVPCLPPELPSGPVRYELDNGRLVTMPPTSGGHGGIETNLTTHLKVQGEWKGYGKVRGGETGLILWRNPDRLVGMDGAFFGNASLPLVEAPEGYLETIPDIVVEVVSKYDSRPYVQGKVDDYLAAGVKEVWVAWPAERTIVVHLPGAEPVTYGEEQELTTPIIPGFLLRVADAFVL